MTPLVELPRLPGWLIFGSVLVLVASVLAFGNSALRTPEFNQLTTVQQVSAYVVEHGAAAWVALDLGLLLGCALMYAALVLVARSLVATNARAWALAGLVALVVSAAFLVFNTYLLVGLAAGPDRLPPFLGGQTVSPERAVVGVLYEHLAGLFAGVGLAAVGIGLFVSGRMRRTGLVVAILALALTAAGLAFGAVVGPIVILSLPIAVGVIRAPKA